MADDAPPSPAAMHPPTDSAPSPDAAKTTLSLPNNTLAADDNPETQFPSATVAQPSYPAPAPRTINRSTERTRKGPKKPKQQAGASSSKPNPNTNADDEEQFILNPVKPGLLEDPDLPVLLSLFHKDRKISLSEDRLTAGSTRGYRMVRATRGVASGAWYFEVEVLHLGPTGGARLGWATDKAHLEAPVGNDGFGFGYRSVDGSKVTKAWRSNYADAYEAGDVLGFYISLPQGEVYEPKQAHQMVKYRGVYFFAKPAKEDETEKPVPLPVPGSEIVYFKNGVCQGTAFDNTPGGRYYPAASMYTMPDEPKCEVKFNFGPDFTFFPEDFGGRPVPRPMSEVPYQPYVLMNEGSAKNGNVNEGSAKDGNAEKAA